MLQIALDVGVGRRINFVAEDGDVGGFGHTLHAQQAGNQNAHLDGNGKVEDHGEEEGHQKYNDIGLGIAQDGAETAPLTHIVGHHHQDTGQAGHRDVLHQGHQEQVNEGQHNGVGNAGYGRAATVVDVGHRTGNGAGGGDAANERRHHIGNALGHQFLVAVVVVANDTVGHRCGQQGLNGTQHSDDHGRLGQTADAVPSNVRNFRLREGR